MTDRLTLARGVLLPVGCGSPGYVDPRKRIASVGIVAAAEKADTPIQGKAELNEQRPLDRSMPLWRQIATILQTGISGGIFAPGARLPTEAELSARFDVNRHTVRRAMEDLENRGLIRVEQGRGSFVTEDVLEYPISARTRFHDNMRRQSKETRSRFVRIEEMPAENQIADDLRLRRGRPVIFAERLSQADGRPIAIGRHWFPAARFPGIATLLAEEESISKVLAQLDVPDYIRRGTRISARLPTGQEAALLEQPRTLPVQVTHAVNLDLQGNPVEVSVGIYPSNRVQIVSKP